MKTTAADILIDTLHDWGVEVVFGLPGDGINGIMEALRKRADKIRFIQVRGMKKPPHSWREPTRPSSRT
jgi:pyruvate dehydrogenase (quinone)